jgi:hypothetical protein
MERTLKGWWFEIAISALGVLAILMITALTLYDTAKFEAYEAHIEEIEKEKAELLQKNADLEEQCLALSNSIEWWMGYAEGASQAREAAFRECE